ncbi:MAG: hypothetical protein ABR540_04460 [Acidimicrobiales bacterium]|nr:hypothetical protein [Actinomycetota bacterium]
MPRHDLDPLSLVAGVAFCGFALVALLDQGPGWGGRWLVPLLLVAVGVVGLLATRSRPDR